MGIEFPLTKNELDNELCIALKPLKLSINALSKGDTDLLYYEILIVFTRKKLDEANTPISQLVKQLFKNRIIERRNIDLIHLMKYLSNLNVLNKEDQFGNNI